MKKFLSHFCERALLVFLDLLHALIDLVFLLVQFLVFSLKIDKSAPKTLDAIAVVVVGFLGVGHYFF